jgi:hypothetical protein
LAQLGRATDLLARLGPISSGKLPMLLTWLTRRVPSGASLVVLTARPPHAVRATLRRLQASGYGVEVLVLGADPQMAAAPAGGVRIRAMTLEPNWETADVVALTA